MGLHVYQIEHPRWAKSSKGILSHRFMKQQRNRKIRRTPIHQVVETKKYVGWEF
jgi:hypothetical protein